MRRAPQTEPRPISVLYPATSAPNVRNGFTVSAVVSPELDEASCPVIAAKNRKRRRADLIMFGAGRLRGTPIGTFTCLLTFRTESRYHRRMCTARLKTDIERDRRESRGRSSDRNDGHRWSNVLVICRRS